MVFLLHIGSLLLTSLWFTFFPALTRRLEQTSSPKFTFCLLRGSQTGNDFDFPPAIWSRDLDNYSSWRKYFFEKPLLILMTRIYEERSKRWFVFWVSLLAKNSWPSWPNTYESTNLPRTKPSITKSVKNWASWIIAVISFVKVSLFLWIIFPEYRTHSLSIVVVVKILTWTYIFRQNGRLEKPLFTSTERSHRPVDGVESKGHRPQFRDRTRSTRLIFD